MKITFGLMDQVERVQERWLGVFIEMENNKGEKKEFFSPGKAFNYKQ